LILLAALPALPQGAVPRGISAWQPIEISDAHWVTPATSSEKPVFRRGTLTLDGSRAMDGRREIVFATTDGEELRIPFASITDLQFGEIASPPKPAKPVTKAVPAAVPVPVPAAIPAKTPAKSAKPSRWASRFKMPKMPRKPSMSLTPHMPIGSLHVLTITHRRGSGLEQSYFRFHKDNSVYMMNAISIKSNVAIRRVGFRDPWAAPAAQPPAPIAAGGAGGS
jgi:hypothetical protein